MLAALASFELFAQTKTVTGKVTDGKSGTPISGVAVSVNGNNVALTGEDGAFTANVPQDAKKLLFKSVGYDNVSADIISGTLMIKMMASDKNLEEVVVTGYKSAQKRSFAGSAGTIKGEEVANVPIASFDQAMQGRTPGLILRANSGQPGASGSAIIRGRGSINGSTEPIYIVDGIQIAAADFSQLNPNDIENISVLKDAVATSLYGSRGGNGMVLSLFQPSVVQLVNLSWKLMCILVGLHCPTSTICS